ncbi:hypothetical protein PHJA_000118400 [Phtheirospermum japonicum]|uniref:DUF599 domain-containing protein n=1 Tax=Phtheirospermum japonicum TaxID=374723 RepID=A0A830B334_9LAMI|nr:hypothetical protein PHJA_000118400 [Phtheirospermum japonicum]
MFKKEYLDIVLVPCGLFIMFSYHLILLYRCLRLPHTTVIGFENNDKKAWVEKIMQSEKRDVNTALNVLSANISVATFLASISLSLSALIGAWISSNTNVFQSDLIYGDTRPATISIKYITLLICFLLAFSCFVHSSRCFIHANYLISTPESVIPTEYVVLAVIRGGDFWSVGLRALYFATALLLWFFGPIPMFVTSVATVVLLHYLDSDTSSMKQRLKKFEGKN